MNTQTFGFSSSLNPNTKFKNPVHHSFIYTIYLETIKENQWGIELAGTWIQRLALKSLSAAALPTLFPGDQNSIGFQENRLKFASVGMVEIKSVDEHSILHLQLSHLSWAKEAAGAERMLPCQMQVWCSVAHRCLFGGWLGSLSSKIYLIRWQSKGCSGLFSSHTHRNFSVGCKHKRLSTRTSSLG